LRAGSLVTEKSNHDADDNEHAQADAPPGTAKQGFFQGKAIDGLAAHHARFSFLGSRTATVQAAALAVIIGGRFSANGAAHVMRC
jgi:hypothetical protein